MDSGSGFDASVGIADDDAHSREDTHTTLTNSSLHHTHDHPHPALYRDFVPSPLGLHGSKQSDDDGNDSGSGSGSSSGLGTSSNADTGTASTLPSSTYSYGRTYNSDTDTRVKFVPSLVLGQTKTRIEREGLDDIDAYSDTSSPPLSPLSPSHHLHTHDARLSHPNSPYTQLIANSQIHKQSHSPESSELERKLDSYANESEHHENPGTLPEDLYEQTMAWWRVSLRRGVMWNLRWESWALARMQASMRTPFLDQYFVYTSTLGTHTFFMTFLPMLFFFGHGDVGSGLVFVLAMGVYTSSVIKDLVCVPRPYAPPVTRLTIGTHHLEYGFPSTHSTNSVSMALFIFSNVRAAYLASLSPLSSSPSSFSQTTSTITLSHTTYVVSCIVLVLYTFSIVFGRLYTGMHSITDCVAGVVLGAGIWAFYEVWGQSAREWAASPGIVSPLLICAMTFILVNQHPQPVDDCPCFEDAIAFISVLMGFYLVDWHERTYGLGYGGKYYKIRNHGVRVADGMGEWEAVWLWWGIAGLKMVIGVAIIFLFRIVAKSLLHLLLPPLFRLLANLIRLPTRRFYTPATDYGSVPSDEVLKRPYPSVMDLPGMANVGSGEEEEEEEEGEEAGYGNGNGYNKHGYNRDKYKTRVGVASSGMVVKSRKGASASSLARSNSDGYTPSEKTSDLDKQGKTGAFGGAAYNPDRDESSKKVKHYDAAVLTKVLVYAGIGILSAEAIPMLFEFIGWGVL